MINCLISILVVIANIFAFRDSNKTQLQVTSYYHKVFSPHIYKHASEEISGLYSQSSYHTFEVNLQMVVSRYVNNEITCFNNKGDKCFSNVKLVSSIVSKYNESDMVFNHYFDNYSVLIQPKIIRNDTKIVIGIPIGPHQFLERFSIRNTWCNYAERTYSTKCLFFCGYSKENNHLNNYLQEEAEKYNDIVQFNFQNSYLNLTLLQLSSYKWILSQYPKLEFFIRSDSDVYLNIDKIHELIKRKNIYAYGKVFSNKTPNRNTDSKWYMPFHIYPGNMYHSFIVGYMYIWSKDILEMIVNDSNYVQPIHYLDDVYYGQIFHERNITMQDCYINYDILPSPLKDLYIEKNTNIIAIHRIANIDLLTIWKLLH